MDCNGIQETLWNAEDTLVIQNSHDQVDYVDFTPVISNTVVQTNYKDLLTAITNLSPKHFSHAPQTVKRGRGGAKEIHLRLLFYAPCYRVSGG